MDKMKKALMIVAIIALVAIAGSMIYYFVFFKPEQQKAEIRLEAQKLEFEKEQKELEQKKIEQENSDKKQQELNKKINLQEALVSLGKWYNDSLDQAYKDYRAQWDEECKVLGLKPGSPLPSAQANILNENYDKAIKRLDEIYQNQKDDIYKLYE